MTQSTSLPENPWRQARGPVTVADDAPIATAASGAPGPVDVALTFATATRLHQAGNLQAAWQLYGAILGIAPDHFGAWCGLGAIHGQQGKLDQAIFLLNHAARSAARSADAQVRIGVILTALNRPEMAIAYYHAALTLKADHADAHLRLANILFALNRPQEAIEHYQSLLAIHPDHCVAHNNIGIAFQAIGQLQSAVVHFQRALAIKPDHAEARGSLGNALRVLNRPHEALFQYKRALAIRPDYADLHNNLAGVLQSLGHFREAIAHYRQALKIKPDYAEAHFNLGSAFEALDRPAEAMACYEAALAVRPNLQGAHNNLGNALQKLGRINEAMVHYQRALDIEPDYAEAHRNLAKALLALDRHEEAIGHYEQSLATTPAPAEVHNNIGIAHHVLGRFEDAYRAYERAVALAPKKATILLNLASLKPFTAPSDGRLLALQALAEPGTSLDPDDEIAMHFGLGKAFTDLDQHERAFQHLITGNALKRRRIIYDETETLRTFARIRAVFGRERVGEPGGDPSEVPVFVVGMPRSGTTLIEQILASHSKVVGAGECEAVCALASTVTGADGAKFPDAVVTLSPEARRCLGSRYLETIQTTAPAAERIVDKMPMNFLYLGFIHMVLPRARIIHVRRDPVDTCCSCFSLLFTGNLAYTYELGELGRYYRAYEALMAHWRAILPKEVMLEVAYEDVVNDLEGQARALLAHCGLEWDAACLAFHRTQRPVLTASAAQVRQPIYRSSVGRSLCYRPFIAELLEALRQPMINEPAGSPEASATTIKMSGPVGHPSTAIRRASNQTDLRNCVIEGADADLS
jgi:tetratricopeptide (TPR) repeat protein